ncbi:MAG: ATP-grasp domain-containing protein [Candidatus Eisenbacteria bacterium]|nr:ATP-grasp domain-containing protein [Candidatus Eisenbacteria bacterium]
MNADRSTRASSREAFRERVLVVGTTPDYIDLLLRRHPGRAFFLTERKFRTAAKEPRPAARDEWATDLLRERGGILAGLRAALEQRRIRIIGVACFDCESLALAAFLARAFNLPFASEEAVIAARDKHECKRIWNEAGLPAPAAALVRDEDEAVRFLAGLRSHVRNRSRRRAGRRGAAHPAAAAIVLKPLTGSGSELVFLCRTEEEVRRAIGVMRARLAHHHDARMYAPVCTSHGRLDPRAVFVAEEFVQGPEYSCDFVLDNERVEIVRIARKIFAPAPPIGTTLAYVIPARLPAGIGLAAFRRQIGAAARALGLRRAMVMLDFILRDGRAVMIEMSPRPGGDCLPPLILASSGLDMLGAALDFATGRALAIPPKSRWKRLVGLRLIARQEGVIARIDPRPLAADRRVLDVHLTRERGHRVILPPANYDSRILGYAIFAPRDWRRLAAECRELRSRLGLAFERASGAAR